MQFAQRLAELMQSNGVSNYRLAKQTGSSPTTVANWLGGALPSSDKLKKIADYFGVTLDYLTGSESVSGGQQEIQMDDFTYAMHGESRHLTAKDKEILLSMARQLAAANQKKGHNGETD